MLATVAEVVDARGRDTLEALVAGFGMKAKGQRPEPFRIEHPDRPNPDPPKRVIADVAEIRDFFANRIR